MAMGDHYPLSIPSRTTDLRTAVAVVQETSENDRDP
jgi:hypothetical protein